jgi:hypothetical protein
LRIVPETFYAASPPTWQPGSPLTPGEDGRVPLFTALEEAVEEVGEYGGLVLEVTVEVGVVTKDPWGGRPYATEAIPTRAIRILGS